MKTLLTVILTLTLASLVYAHCGTCAAKKKPACDSKGTALFDGKTLKGWSVKSGTATYVIDDGAILGTTAKGSPNSFLTTDKQFADFELTFDVLLHDSQLNSGVQIRSTLKGDKHGGRLNGPQVEIEASPGQSGFIYGEALGTGWLSPEPKSKDKNVNQTSHFKNNQWNHYRILAVGPRIQTWINGQKIADLTNEAVHKTHPKGHLGLQVHGIGKKAGPFKVRWKNIVIKEIKK